MIKGFAKICLLSLALTACASLNTREDIVDPDYNHIAEHVRVIDKTSNYVVYEYMNIRVDEVAPVAALYCNDQGGKQANLYNIELRPDNRRRVVFACR